MGSKSKTKKDEIKSTTKYRNGTKESKKGKCSGYKKYVDQKSFVGKKRTIEKNYEGKFGIIIGYSIGSKSINNNYEIISKQQKRKRSKKIKKGKRSGYNK